MSLSHHLDDQRPGGSRMMAQEPGRFPPASGSPGVTSPAQDRWEQVRAPDPRGGDADPPSRERPKMVAEV